MTDSLHAKEANLSKQVAEMQGRIDSLENILNQGKDVLTLEEAAKFMGIARSSLYKLTHEQLIPFFKPNGKMVFFEKADLVAWMKQNRVSSKKAIAAEADQVMQRLAKSNFPSNPVSVGKGRFTIVLCSMIRKYVI